jgi:hypothetical protein
VLRHLALLPLVLLAACSGTNAPARASFSQPPASAFAAGPCSAVAPAVLALGKDAHDLAGGKEPSPATSASLKTNQQLIVAVQPGLDPALAPSFSDLVIKVGLVRIRTDTNTYVSSLAPSLMASYSAVVKACTTGPAPTATP